MNGKKLLFLVIANFGFVATRTYSMYRMQERVFYQNGQKLDQLNFFNQIIKFNDGNFFKKSANNGSQIVEVEKFHQLGGKWKEFSELNVVSIKKDESDKSSDNFVAEKKAHITLNLNTIDTWGHKWYGPTAKQAATWFAGGFLASTVICGFGLWYLNMKKN